MINRFLIVARYSHLQNILSIETQARSKTKEEKQNVN